MAYELAKKALCEAFLQGLPEEFLMKVEKCLQRAADAWEGDPLEPLELLGNMSFCCSHPSASPEDIEVDNFLQGIDLKKEEFFPDIWK